MLRGLFSLDNPVMRFLSRVADVMALNLLFIICSIPIVTIGASLTAMYYCLFKIKEEEEGYLVKKFFHSFRENFRQATLMWLIFLALAILLILEFLMYRKVDGSIGTAVRAIVLVGAIFWYLIGTYAFALQSRFYNSIKNTLTNAILLMFANGPRTIAILALTAAILAFTLMQTSTVIVWNLILLWILFGFAAIATINVQFLYPVIRKLMPEEAKEEAAPDSAFSVNEEADLSSLGYAPAVKKTDETAPAGETSGETLPTDIPAQEASGETLPTDTPAKEASGETPPTDTSAKETSGPASS
jgi:uncharacterized membrane protein YesL